MADRRTPQTLPQRLAESIAAGEDTLKQRLMERGLAVESETAYAEYRRALDAIQRVVLANLPYDLADAEEMALLYVVGRIDFVIQAAESNAQARATQDRTPARTHWFAAVAAAKRRANQRKLG